MRTKIETRGRKPKNLTGNRVPWTGRLDPKSHVILQNHSVADCSQAEIVDAALQLWERKTIPKK